MSGQESVAVSLPFRAADVRVARPSVEPRSAGEDLWEVSVDHQSSELVEALDQDTRASLSHLMGTNEEDAVYVLGQAFDADAALRDTVRLALSDAAYLDADTKARTIYGTVWPPAEETEYQEAAEYAEYSADTEITGPVEGTDATQTAEPPMASLNEDLIPALDEFVSSPEGFVALWSTVEEEVLGAIKAEFPDGIEEQDVAAVVDDLYDSFVDALCETLADESGWAEAIAALSQESDQSKGQP